MSEPIIIKKYPNRRLYNTSTRSYINLLQIEELVKKDIEFKVIDEETQKDITRLILFQILLEDMKNYEPILPSEFLKHMIKHKDIAKQHNFQNFLSKIFEYWSKFEEQYLSQIKKQDPFSFIFSPFNFFSKFSTPGDVNSLKEEILNLKKKISSLEEELLKKRKK